jgi:hypothetical protein
LTSIAPGVSRDHAPNPSSCATQHAGNCAQNGASAAEAIYLVGVNSSSFVPDEVRAAAEIHDELGPDYRGAVIESFLDKVGKEIDARVDARLAEARPAPPAHPSSLPVVVLTLIASIPLTAIAATRPSELVVVWIGLVLINLGFAVRRPPRSGR